MVNKQLSNAWLATAVSVFKLSVDCVSCSSVMLIWHNCFHVLVVKARTKMLCFRLCFEFNVIFVNNTPKRTDWSNNFFYAVICVKMT